MDTSLDRCSARTRSNSCDADTKTRADLDHATVKAMLSELGGTPLRGGAWDAEAGERLKAFQRSEGIFPTGNPDDVTMARLERRFSEASASRAAETVTGPSAEAHGRVTHAVHLAVHAAMDVAKELGHDAPIRARYVAEVEAWGKTVVQAFERGQLTEAEAALIANKMRNAMLADARTGLSPSGAAISKYLKEEGLTLAKACERQAAKMFAGRAFKDLSQAERSAVLVRIAERAGVTNETVNAAAKLAPAAGRALQAVAIGMAVYQVAQAEDKVAEGVAQGASFLGFWAGAKVGAAVGAAACGPGAPACAVVGMIAGGVLGSLLAEEGARRATHAIRG